MNRMASDATLNEDVELIIAFVKASLDLVIVIGRSG
jgi:hypothetical protein